MGGVSRRIQPSIPMNICDYLFYPCHPWPVFSEFSFRDFAPDESAREKRADYSPALIRACAAEGVGFIARMNPTTSAHGSTRTANADYTVVDRSPLTLAVGDTVTLGREDKAWEGWVWATTAEGRGTYLPVSFLEEIAEGQARLKEDFAAIDLSVRKGDAVSCLREVSGWFWCRDAAGREGWLPDYVLGSGGSAQQLLEILSHAPRIEPEPHDKL